VRARLSFRPPQSATTAGAATTSVSSYAVQAGDTLSLIAAQYRTTVPSLVALNRIGDPNLIYVGQVLRVQVSPYTVQPGDTLAGIASRYGLTVEELAAGNGISNPNLIVIGQVLQVGGGHLPPVTLPAPLTPVTAPPPAATSGVVTPPAITTTTRTAPTATVSSSNSAANSSANSAAGPAAAPVVGSGTYTVEPGDTLFGLAAKFDTTVATLIEANHLTGDTIDIGQVLQVGGQGANAVPKTPTVASTPPTTTPGTVTTDSDSTPAPTSPPAATPPSTSSTPAPSGASSGSTSGQSFSSLEACIIRAESSGNPQARSPNGQYWGLFQFSKSTWIEYGGAPGAWGNASAAVQEQVFANAIADGGADNWTPYDGC